MSETKQITDFKSSSKQRKFNEIKGCIAEFNEHEKYPSITILSGHDNPRPININVKKELYETIKERQRVGDSVTCRFFLSSNKKNEKWYTSVNLLSITHE